MSGFITQKLRTGDAFLCITHAEFLNEVFGTNYKAWMKGSWKYTEDILVWFVRINGTYTGGFKNYWQNSNTIIQICDETKNEFGGIPLHFVKIPDYRLVFEIIDGYQRKYIFKGLFRYNREKSVPKKLVFEKISDVFPI